MNCPPKGDFSVGAGAMIRTILFDPGRTPALLAGKGEACGPDTVPAWGGFLTKAQREGVSSLLFHQLRRAGLADRLPPIVLDALAESYWTQLRVNLRNIAALREVLTLFAEEGIACIGLKGMVLAERIYPHIALRGMSDVDLLIKKGDLFRADAGLARVGYAPQDGTAADAVHNPPGYLASLEYRRIDRPALNLHLHWHPVNTSVPATAYAACIELDRIWEKAPPVRIADRDIRMLCPEHLILYLCEHALRVGHSFDRLILICDLYYAVRSFEGRIDWQRVVAESRRWNIDRLVFHALCIVKGQTGLTTLDGCIADLRPAALTVWERLFNHLQRCGRPIRGGSYFLHLALQRGLLGKMRFIVRTFFPPRSILMQRRAERVERSALLVYGDRIVEICSHFWDSLVSLWKRNP